MAYARFIFPKGLEVLKKLKEIVRFATGQISSTSDLEFAYQNVSEIVIIDAPGWSLLNQSFESSGTATINSYRLLATCVTNTKIKNLLIETRSVKTLSGTGDYTFPNPTTSSVDGYVDFSLGTSWTGNTLNNRIPRSFADNLSSGTVYFYGTSLSSDTIFVFCSERKFIIYSPESNGVFQLEAILEFPETPHTLKHNNIPALTSSIWNADVNSASKVSPITGGVYTSTSAFVYYRHILLYWYNVQDKTTKNRGLEESGVNNIEFFTNPTLTLNSSGQPSYSLIPIIDLRYDTGEYIHNYSKLTDMYIIQRSIGYAGFDDIINVSGQDYVTIQVGNSESVYRAYAIKKG